jgi:hypothetical protein
MLTLHMNRIMSHVLCSFPLVPDPVKVPAGNGSCDVERGRIS